MTPAEFRKGAKALLNVYESDVKIAAALGCAPTTLRRWRKIGAPPYVDLAIAALLEGLPAFSDLEKNRPAA